MTCSSSVPCPSTAATFPATTTKKPQFPSPSRNRMSPGCAARRWPSIRHSSQPSGVRVTGRTRFRCGSVCTAMLASSCAGHIPMLARGGGPHIIRPASSEADAAHADLPRQGMSGCRRSRQRGTTGRQATKGRLSADVGHADKCQRAGRGAARARDADPGTPPDPAHGRDHRPADRHRRLRVPDLADRAGYLTFHRVCAAPKLRNELRAVRPGRRSRRRRRSWRRPMHAGRSRRPTGRPRGGSPP